MRSKVQEVKVIKAVIILIITLVILSGCTPAYMTQLIEENKELKTELRACNQVLAGFGEKILNGD